MLNDIELSRYTALNQPAINGNARFFFIIGWQQYLKHPQQLNLLPGDSYWVELAKTAGFKACQCFFESQEVET